MPNLNPQTLAKLREFGRRQRWLLFVRAACVAILSFLIVMSLIALVDWLWVLPIKVRWLLSLGGYAIVICLTWWTALRQWFVPQNPETLALRFEEAEPDLRENLLSAVELADERGTANGSAQFRELLQNQVASRIRKINIRNLLPTRLIGRWVVGAVVVVCLFGTMLSMPGWSFRHLITRAVVPGANIDRVSLTKVEVLKPNPASQVVPRGETIAIVVQLTGVTDVREVILESTGDSSGRQRQSMRAQGDNRYAANITVRDPFVDYRILAGDAITRRYRLQSQPRPRVEAFEKTYRYPAYSLLDAETITETDGDLVALEGTEVDLLMKVDQPIAKASIVMLRFGNDRRITIDVQPREDGHLAATIPIKEAGTFKVELESKETGFKNTFSPKYEIRPEIDMVPRVGFLNQSDTTLLRPPGDILVLDAMAEDDLPLVELRQMVSVGGGVWKQTPLEIQTSRRVTLRWEMDLLPLGLTSGDTLTMKLLAIDRKGQRGESVPLKIVITSEEFDPNRHDALTVKARVADALAHLAASLEQAMATSEEIFQRHREARIIPESDQAALMDIANKVEEQAADAARIIVALLPRVPAGMDAYEVELVAQMLSQIRQREARQLRSFDDRVDRRNATSPIDKGLYDDYQHRFKMPANQSRKLERWFRDFLSHDLMGAVAIDLDAIYRLQAKVVDSGEQFSPARLRRHQEVVVSHLAALETMMIEHEDRIRGQSKHRYQDLQRLVISLRDELQIGLDNADDHSPLQRATERLYHNLRNRRAASMADGELPTHVGNSRRDLLRRVGVLADELDAAIRAAQELVEARRSEREAKASADIEAAQSALDQKLTTFDRHYASLQAQIADRLAAASARTDRLPVVIADMSLADRAVDHVFGQMRSEMDDQPMHRLLENMRIIRDAYRNLEAGHTVGSLQPLAVQLLADERWASQNFQSRITGPRIWTGIHQGVEVAIERGNSVQWPDEVIQRMNSMRWGGPLDRAGPRIIARRWQPKIVSAAEGVEVLVQRFAAAHEKIDPILAAARRRIAALLPSIPETAKALAEKAKQLEKQTDSLAGEIRDQTAKKTAADTDDPAKESSPEETLQQLQASQQRLNEQIEELLAALTEDAARQDLMSDEGRERARDADDSIGMIEQPSRQAEEDLEAAASAVTPDEKADELDRASDQQQNLAEALEQVAEHFEKMDAGEHVADSRDGLRKAEAELPGSRELSRQYSKAERLAKLAEQTRDKPEALIERLKRELQKSPEMQDALSDIAAEAAAQTLQALDHSKQQEDAAIRALERSDPQLHAEKRKMRQDLQDIAREAQVVADRLTAQAEQAAIKGRQSRAAQQAREARQQLQAAVHQARQIGDDHLMSEIGQAAADVSEKLDDAKKNLEQAAQQAKQAQNEAITDDPRQQQRSRKELERAAKDVQQALTRAAREQVKHAQNYERHVESALRNAENNARNHENDAKKAEDEAKKYPDSQWHQQDAAGRRARADQTKQAAEAEKALLEDARERTAEATQRREEAEKYDVGKLDAANPAAQLAAIAAQRAAEMTERMTEKVHPIAKPSEASQELAASLDQLQAAQHTQQAVAEDVLAAAEDLSRAARHEQRMNQSPATAARLEQAASQVDAVAKNEVAAAGQKAAQAADQRKQGDAPSSDEAPPKDNGQSTPSAEATKAMGAASSAIGAQADRVAEMLAGSQASADADQAPSGEPHSGQPQSGQPLAAQQRESAQQRGERLAKMLDDLDRRMASATSPPSASAGQTPQLDSMPSIAQMAAQQAAEMSQSRSARATEPNQPSTPPSGATASGEGADLDPMDDEAIAAGPVDRNGDDWGRLREQKAEKASRGRRSELSSQYRDHIKAYFKVIAERSRE